MRKNRKICFVMLLLLIHSILAGCAPGVVSIQTIDKQFIAPKKTNLVAGLKDLKDNRPESEKENDQRYDKPSQITIKDNLYKNLKLSNMFQDVLIGKFDNNNIDVLLEPSVDHFYYENAANGWTPVSFLFAITGFPGLIYLLAGGPTSEHNSEANIGIKMTTIEGKVLASGSGEKKLSVNSNLHNNKSDGIGMLEGKALGDATYETLSSLAMNIDSITLPVPKLPKLNQCGSDKDCKGERVCVDGACVNPK